MKRLVYTSVLFFTIIMIMIVFQNITGVTNDTGYNNTSISNQNFNHNSDSNNISCDSTLWKHVYTSSRLIVLQNCIEASGIIMNKPKKEGDGDYHILLKLDSGQEYLINKRNYEAEDGYLVIEPICVNKISWLYKMLFADLPEACAGCVNKVYIPKKGEHVKVTGTYVIDNGSFPKHGWTEIHPVSKIEVIE
jgi:hypothetical protein